MTWRLRIAKSFSSNTQDGDREDNLETLQTTSDNLIWPPWHNVTYNNQPNLGERFPAHLGLFLLSQNSIGVYRVLRGAQNCKTVALSTEALSNK